MLLREFLMLRVAPHQARMRPLWRLGDEEDKVLLSSEALPNGELAAALRLLVGDDQEYPPSVFIPLFRRTDGAQVMAARPSFDGRGLVPSAPTEAHVAPTPVELSSDDNEANSRQEKGEPPVVPTRGRSALVSRDASPALTPPGAASGPSAAPASAPGACAPAPQAPRLSGFKLSKRRVDYAVVDQPPPAAKKRKEDAAAPLGTEPSAAAAPPSVEKGSDITRTSSIQSPSRGLEEHPHGETAPVAPLAPEALVSSPAAGVPKAKKPPVFQALVTTPCASRPLCFS
nr:translation initiation factor IF-2-like [Aegilops tauschii subsp. strangulata]